MPPVHSAMSLLPGTLQGKGLLPRCFQSIFSSSSLWESRLKHSGEQEDRWSECGADRFGYCPVIRPEVAAVRVDILRSEEVVGEPPLGFVAGEHYVVVVMVVRQRTAVCDRAAGPDASAALGREVRDVATHPTVLRPAGTGNVRIVERGAVLGATR